MKKLLPPLLFFAAGCSSHLPPSKTSSPSQSPLRILPPKLSFSSACLPWRNFSVQPTLNQIKCTLNVHGRGKFGLSYFDLPVYQTTSALPGTHVVGVRGLPAPPVGKSYEEWEWSVHNRVYGREEQVVFTSLEFTDSALRPKLVELERGLSRERIYVRRRETWRAPERQAFLFQQGRSRGNYLVTSTLTSWHSYVDSAGSPASLAADYDVRAKDLVRFHEIAQSIGLSSYGAQSNDPGHVFLPPSVQHLQHLIPVLRVYPRVTEVSIATGRPADENVSSSLRASYREVLKAWIQFPFLREPRLNDIY